jgi:MtaA/CmuA family methyltransferase
MNGRERILATLQGRERDSLAYMPITMMIAADEIGVPYGTYATDAKTLARGQMAIADRFDVDYVSAISDPAVEASACGAAIRFYHDQPPAVDEENALLADKDGLRGLSVPNLAASERPANRLRAVELLRKGVGGEKIVEGWIEGPCAEAADLRGINRLMMDFYDDSEFLGDLFDFVVEMERTFAREQIRAGADIIGIGDAAASLVGPELYRRFVLPRERELVDAIHEAGAPARLHICGTIRPLERDIATLGADIVDLDSMNPVAEARATCGPGQVLLGNIDPVRVVRNGTPEHIHAELEACYHDAGMRYIVGAGCEIPRGTPEANFLAMTRFARSHG